MIICVTITVILSTAPISIIKYFYHTANDVCNIMLKSDDAYGNFVELQSSYLAANGFTCEDVSWDHTVAYLSDTTKVGIRSSYSSSSSL